MQSNSVWHSLLPYRNRFAVLFGALLLALPFSAFFTSLMVLFIFVNFWLQKFWTGWNSLWHHPFLWLMVVFFGLQILGIYITPEEYQSLAIKKLETKLPFVLVPVFFAHGFAQLQAHQTKKLLLVFLGSAVAAGLFCEGYAAYQVATTGSWHSTWSNGSLKHYHFFYAGLSDVLMHPGYLSTFVGAALLVGFWFLLEVPLTRAQKLAFIAVQVFLFLFLMQLQGRINILAFFAVVGMGSLLLLFKRGNTKLLMGAVASVFLLVWGIIQFAPAPLAARFTGLNNFGYTLQAPEMSDFNGITIRLAEWECVREAIARTPWYGVGQGGAQPVLRVVYAEKNFVVGMSYDFNAHNQLYETRLANGIPGLVVLVLLFVAGFYRAWRTKNYLLLAFLVFYFISFLSESMLERQKGVMLFCMVGAWLAAVPPLRFRVGSGASARGIY